MRGASILLAVALLVTASITAWAQVYDRYSPAELDELLGPIALYPDPLIAQILPAATYPDQLDQAYTSQGGIVPIDRQPWDTSVKAVAHYPSVLRMMATDLDWTIAVGQAYVSQPDDVMRSIQRLRVRARNFGYLSSNSYQTVIVSNGYISIVPAQARYVYVPTYNPSVVYVQRRPSYGGNWISFGTGLLIGAWLNNAFDWHHHRVYNHGWRGGGWVGRSRPHVRTNDRYYVNPSWVNRSVTGNRDIRSRDITNYRREIQRNRGRYTPPGVTTPVAPPQGGRRPPTSTRPGRTEPTPGAVTPRPAPPTTPGVTESRPPIRGTGPVVQPRERRATPPVSTRSNRARTRTQPNTVAPRTAAPSAPRANVRRGTAPGAGVSRPTPSTRQSAGQTRQRTKPSKETKTRGERR